MMMLGTDQEDRQLVTVQIRSLFSYQNFVLAASTYRLHQQEAHLGNHQLRAHPNTHAEIVERFADIRGVTCALRNLHGT